MMRDILDFPWFWAILYIAPSLIAAYREHRNYYPIMWVNLFLGWSIIGWIVAFSWSFSANTKNDPS